MSQETEASSLIYTTGCIESLTNWINNNLHIVGGLAFGFAVIQVRGASFLFPARAKPGMGRSRRREIVSRLPWAHKNEADFDEAI